MKRYPVITISRQYGSGGREIGAALASKLGIPYYDNELITLAAEESGFDRALFENADKNASNSLLFSLSMYSGSTGTYNMPLGDRVFLIQSDIIRKVAEKPCVVVGRCADYVLRELPDHISVFVHAPIEWRVERAVGSYGLPLGRARDEIALLDKKRAVYYAHFTGEKWGASQNYDLTINAKAAGVGGCVETIAAFAEQAAVRDTAAG